MDNLLLVLNLAACALLAGVCTWAVLSPRVRDGIVVKVGLISAAGGFAGLGLVLGDGQQPITLVRALGLLHAGLLVVVVGWWWRRSRVGRPQRRASDWMDLPSATHRPLWRNQDSRQ